MSTYITSRTETVNSDGFLSRLFPTDFSGPSDSLFLSAKRDCAAGICGLPFKAPVLKELRKNPEFTTYLSSLQSKGHSTLFQVQGDGKVTAKLSANGIVTVADLPSSLLADVANIARACRDWAGTLNDEGEHVIDLKAPSPGPHFFVNLLLGNRMDFAHPLQTTPKSVVDRLGRGSFRSHAATQVLATRWDLRQEENGFPCNRQFYIVENGKQAFYSADPEDTGVIGGTCVHGQNHTRIQYDTACHLRIERTIFLPHQAAGLPLACEIQRVSIRNDGPKERTLKIVYTGMFGPTKPGALQEDVLYSNIIMEGGAVFNDDGTVRAVSPNYFPAQDKEDLRFHSMIVRSDSGNRFPDEFCLNYNDFVGRGTLEKPDGVTRLPCELSRKGPGFFALSSELTLKPGQTAIVDNFTGLVSSRANPSFDAQALLRETDALLRHFDTSESVSKALSDVREFARSYCSFFSLKTDDKAFSSYCSKNLPFQVLYQTFVSRSFGQTQKGYREIGFREIQDLFASVHYFHAQGKGSFPKQLIKDWASQVHEFGYANHNFFWQGKEAGHWSDDALWLHQAVGRYVRLTGDSGILDEEVTVAGASPERKRTLYETLKAAIHYSTVVSVGPHGLPLLDRADWNDCLRLDRNYQSGAEKEEAFTKGKAIKSGGTESVMNGFLAVLALREMRFLAGEKGDADYAQGAATEIEALSARLRKHAWKGDRYARLLFNQYPGFEYAGADGDGLATDGSEGTFFLNSFSWAILSGVATEEEICSMLAAIKRKLKTPFGLKLVSPNDLSRVVPEAASAEYFPGDRENGAVFKHASMMAVSAMIDASKTVKSRQLAEDLASEAWSMIDLAYPARTMSDPYVLAGNPRFCTQYNNSQTGENIGPLLSGTATWLILSLLKAYGVELSRNGLTIDPILRSTDTASDVTIRLPASEIRISFSKPKGFMRASETPVKITVDGEAIQGLTVKPELLKGNRAITVTFGS